MVQLKLSTIIGLVISAVIVLGIIGITVKHSLTISSLEKDLKATTTELNETKQNLATATSDIKKLKEVDTKRKENRVEKETTVLQLKEEIKTIEEVKKNPVIAETRMNESFLKIGKDFEEVSK